MERSTSRNLYLIGLVLGIVGLVLYFLGAASAISSGAVSSTGTVNQTLSGSTTALILVAILVFIIAGILSAIGWIGALVKMARLSQWVWFILLIVFSGITMLVYIFAGPTEPAAAS